MLKKSPKPLKPTASPLSLIWLFVCFHFRNTGMKYHYGIVCNA